MRDRILLQHYATRFFSNVSPAGEIPKVQLEGDVSPEAKELRPGTQVSAVAGHP